MRSPSVIIGLALVVAPAARAQVREWPVHSMERPQPTIIRPGGMSSVMPPSDAIVLFDGRTLGEWRSSGDTTKPARWEVKNGSMEVVPRTGGIETRRGFGDVQLHVEWASPSAVRGTGQERGNSGVFLMGRYEVQVLDSHGNVTYPDGQAGALYGQRPPLVNASLPPGQWQSYDIVFRRPRFDQQGKVTRPARVTLIHNGVLVQDASELTGPTTHQARPPYSAHADKLPIGLQDHGEPVRYRNIWVRELPEATP